MSTTQDNKAKPIVSFVITYYNIPVSMLRECIESILSLSLSDSEREIILIDDGSDISPLNEMMDFRDKVLYLRERNRGLSEARNIGIDLCHGEYIQFVDADDCLIRAGYEHCLDIVRYQHPDLVMFNLSREGTEIDTPYLFDGPMTGSEFMKHNNLRASACGYIFKKKMLIDLRFTPNLLHEDEEFTPQIVVRAETLYSTDTCAYYYRERPKSITHENNTRWKLRRLDDAEYIIIQLSRLSDSMPSAERVAMQRRVAQLTMDYIYNVIILTKSERMLEERLDRLHEEGLFPLPDRKYTSEYKYFRKMTNSQMGRKILIRTLPWLAKE